MRVDHLPCGECVNESERIAVEHLLSKLRGHDAPTRRWIVLSNVPSAVNDRAIPNEIGLVCISPSGFFVIVAMASALCISELVRTRCSLERTEPKTPTAFLLPES